ncbi:MAG: protein kinase [Bacteroidetes bacterium]|nr:protein kinase [Bacteroidota bacterium]
MTDELYDNKYKFIKSLGSGGFGTVFLAIEEHSENIVAIKKLHNFSYYEVDDLYNEIQSVSKFNHPNIINYKHCFEEERKVYLVMEHCEGGSLSQMMNTENGDLEKIWDWMLILTETMQFVHNKGIVHHDLKPANILFTEDGVIKIADFGLANSANGTISYLCPRASQNLEEYCLDPRVDIYSLGVTLLEVLTGENPFYRKSTSRIQEIYYQCRLKIDKFPSWQQAIILKAIHPEPGLRFQTMDEFNHAIKEQAIPFIINKDAIKAGDIAEKANHLIENKKWLKALALLDYAEKTLKPSISIQEAKGKYHLLQGNIELAKQYFEKALKWNPRIDIQKELGWINLEHKNYPMAISLLSDYIHRNPTDMETYNLLMKCYYETNRYEQVINIAEPLLKINPSIQCIQNNLYLAIQLYCIKEKINPTTLFKKKLQKHYFLDYNYELVMEKEVSHNYSKDPTLKSKMLYMDYRFNNFIPGTLFFRNQSNEASNFVEINSPIIKIGKEGFPLNTIEILGDTKVSRRHCAIINSKNDVWLSNLSSSGTF